MKLWITPCLVIAGALASTQARGAPAKPNIVFILADDLGMGDVKSLSNGLGKIETPNIDKFVSEGMSFRQAHSASAVCTPSRYAILTGRYNWRTRLQKGVLGGMGEPLIAKGRLTVAEMLEQEGYSTACFGKWHLGLDFGAQKLSDPIVDGPLQHGFQYFFGISASLDMPPFAWIEDAKFTEPVTATKKWVRSGPAGVTFEAVNVVPELTKRAVGYVKGEHRDAGKPFFLYLPFPSPHTPIVPSKEWEGKSGLSPYGDYVMETDWAVGEVLKAIDAAGLRENTLVVFTSDNGCSPAAKVEELEAKGHFPSAGARGYKADIWEGGHRIPFVVR